MPFRGLSVVIAAVLLAPVACRSHGTDGAAMQTEVAGGAEPLGRRSDSRKERMRQALRGLRFESGSIEVDQAEAARRVGGRPIEDARAEFERGQAMLRRNAFTEAIACLARAILIDPAPPQYYEGLGGALLAKGRSDQAAAAFRAAIARSPGTVDAHFKLGRAMQEVGRWEEAIAAWDECARLDPGHGEAQQRSAIAWYFWGDFARAWENVHRAEALAAPPPPQFRTLLQERMAEPLAAGGRP